MNILWILLSKVARAKNKSGGVSPTRHNVTCFTGENQSQRVSINSNQLLKSEVEGRYSNDQGWSSGLWHLDNLFIDLLWMLKLLCEPIH